MSALVSIIIPVYNLEEYIENCLNSVVAQTYGNLEIICIDDGSTDASAEKIRAMSEKDSRIRYLRQENAGVSAARNRGLDEATGDYIMFVDGDDYLHFQAVEIFIKEIVDSSYDMVCACELFTPNTNEKMDKITEYSIIDYTIEDMFNYKTNRCPGKSVWGKIIRADVAHRIRFPEGISNGEDGYYIIMLLESGIRIRFIDTVLYYYLNRAESAVTSGFSFRKFSITYSFDTLCGKLENSSNSFLVKYCLQYLFQTIFYNRTCSIGTECEKLVKSESKRIGKKWIKSLLKNKDISGFIKISFVIFFYFRPIYELARGIQDPTMFEFYRNRRKGKSDGEA